MACHLLLDAVVIIISFLFSYLYTFPMIYEADKLTFISVCYIFLAALLIFIALSFMAMVVTYIAQIRHKMNRLMGENLNLFDKMHEGIIVLSKQDRVIQFASRPAVKLL